MDTPINKFSLSDFERSIKKEINVKKVSGFDLLTGNMLQALPGKSQIAYCTDVMLYQD